MMWSVRVPDLVQEMLRETPFADIARGCAATTCTDDGADNDRPWKGGLRWSISVCVTVGFAAMQESGMIGEWPGCCFFGRRPPIKTVMEAFRDEVLRSKPLALGGTKPPTRRAAVLVCGPADMMDAVRQAADSLSSASLQFDVHREVFDW